MVTASGGAWNASIVAEYFHFKGQIYTTVGLGATISQATDSGNFDLLLAATIMMAATVVTINRLVWRRCTPSPKPATGLKARPRKTVRTRRSLVTSELLSGSLPRISSAFNLPFTLRETQPLYRYEDALRSVAARSDAGWSVLAALPSSPAWREGSPLSIR